MDQPLLDHVIQSADLHQLETLHKKYRAIADDLGRRITKITEKTESARRLRSRRQMEMNNERATKVLEHQHRTGCTRLQACQHVASETGDTPELCAGVRIVTGHIIRAGDDNLALSVAAKKRRRGVGIGRFLDGVRGSLLMPLYVATQRIEGDQVRGIVGLVPV